MHSAMVMISVSRYSGVKFITKSVPSYNNLSTKCGRVVYVLETRIIGFDSLPHFGGCKHIYIHDPFVRMYANDCKIYVRSVLHVIICSGNANWLENCETGYPRFYIILK